MHLVTLHSAYLHRDVKMLLLGPQSNLTADSNISCFNNISGVERVGNNGLEEDFFPEGSSSSLVLISPVAFNGN